MLSENCLAVEIPEVLDGKYDDVHSFPKNGDIVITYVDTGQGLCQVVQCSDKKNKQHAVVADCGGSQDGLNDVDAKNFLKKLLPENTSVTLSISHPHVDHYDKLVLLEKLKLNIKKDIYVGGIRDKHKDNFMNVLNKIIPDHNYNIIYSEALQPSCEDEKCSAKSFSCGDKEFLIVHAESIVKTDDNAYSLAIYSKLNSQTSVLFQGDLPKKNQNDAYIKLNNKNLVGTRLSTDKNETASGVMLGTPSIFSASHHGAAPKNSFDDKWTKLMSPSTVSISAGRNMSYKHPQEATVESFEKLLTDLHSIQPAGFGHNIRAHGPVSLESDENKNKMEEQLNKLNTLRNGSPIPPRPMEIVGTARPTLDGVSAPFVAPPPATRPDGVDINAALNSSRFVLKTLSEKVGVLTTKGYSTKNLISTIEIMESHINKYNITGNASYVNYYDAQLENLDDLIYAVFHNKSEKGWIERWTSTQLFTTEANGSLSYFINNAGISKLVCYQSESSIPNKLSCKPSMKKRKLEDEKELPKKRRL